MKKQQKLEFSLTSPLATRVLAGAAALSVAFAVFVALRYPTVKTLIDPSQSATYYLTHTSDSTARLKWCSAHSPLPKAYATSCEATLISTIADEHVVERLSENPALLTEGLNSCGTRSFTNRARRSEDIACASALVARAQLAETR